MRRPKAVRVASEVFVALGVRVQQVLEPSQKREPDQDVVAHEETVDESGLASLIPSLERAAMSPNLTSHPYRLLAAVITLDEVLGRRLPYASLAGGRGRQPRSGSNPAGVLFSSPGTLLTLVPGSHRSALPTQPPSSSQECGWSQGASTPMTWSAHIGLPASR